MTENSTDKPSPGNETITGRTAREEACHLLPTEHERIWLEPPGAPDRCWCQDNVWGDEAVEFVRVDLITPAPATQMVGFQERVAAAHIDLFDGDPTDIAERRDRNFEEALETAQAFGMTADEAHQLVDYTFSRPVGDPSKEIGSMVLTAYSLGVVAGIDVTAAAEADLTKLQQPETIARIRAKRATRHGRGPLPGLSPDTKEGQTNG
ncbi:hypothetical protein [Neorhizobium sp. NCHU2750]|uniref:hypothetical protein n=1 Tax=Neorhizobium sp. NCHU2750 TaxID=1825976 RepID=UPI000EB62CC2|nr:hypothetical protein NCHU2750_05980 [Neorhizobium sp. NCHU2750]